MRTLIQRVSSASVSVDSCIISSINHGLLILLGIETTDDLNDIDWLTTKIARLRIFEDIQGKMNLSILETAGEILVVSQFTLHASTKNGNRPSFLNSAHPSISEPLYQKFCHHLSQQINKPVAQGIFGADMKVSLTNDGPVTIWIDSKKRE